MGEPNSCVVKCMLPTAWLNSRGAYSKGRGMGGRIMSWQHECRHEPRRTCSSSSSSLCIFDLTTISRQMQSEELSIELPFLLLTRLDCQAGLLGLLAAHQNTAQRFQLSPFSRHYYSFKAQLTLVNTLLVALAGSGRDRGVDKEGKQTQSFAELALTTYTCRI